jgi:hypothetical protein
MSYFCGCIVPILLVILLIVHFNPKKSVVTPKFKSMVDMGRTPLGMMAIADWDDPNDPIAVALDLGLDPVTGEPWDDMPGDWDVPEEPYIDPGEDW